MVELQYRLFANDKVIGRRKNWIKIEMNELRKLTNIEMNEELDKY